MTLVPHTTYMTTDVRTERFISAVRQANWEQARELMKGDMSRWMLCASRNDSALRLNWEEMPEDVKNAIRSEWTSASESR